MKSETDGKKKYIKVDLKSKKTNRWVRLGILSFVLLLTTGIGLLHQLYSSLGSPNMDALCPFGAVEAAYTLLVSGIMLKRLALSAFILFVGVMVVALIFRRSFCGLICPLGFLQELFARLGKKIIGRQFVMPSWLDRPARFIKYLVLVLIVVFTAQAGELVFRPYDPWLTYHHLASADLWADFSVGLIVLIITIVGSFFYDRFFCKYLCPMGAFLAPFNKIGWFGIDRNEETCIDCKACNKICPVQIKVTETARINDLECIGCNECVNVCPVADTLTVVGPRNGRRVKESWLPALVLGIFMVIIAGTTYTGDFSWKTPSLQEQVKTSGDFDSSLIKGKMTLQEIVDASGIPARVFEDKLKVKPEEFTTPIKDLGAKYGFETDSVRIVVDETLIQKK